jgi:DNA polymerase III subunit epsilon
MRIWHRLRYQYYRFRLGRKNLPVDIQNYFGAFEKQDLQRTIRETEFVVFDTETTGGHVKKGDRVVSISAVRLKQGRIDLSDSFHEMVNPDRGIPSSAAVVHEILPRMLDGKPTIDEILPKFIGYIGTSVMVAHHAWFDMSFLNREMVRLYGFPILNVVLDTALFDQALMQRKTLKVKIRQTDGSLEEISERYCVYIEDRHSSFGDTLGTAQIFQNMLKQIEEKDIVYLEDLIKIINTPSGSDLDQRGIPSM